MVEKNERKLAVLEAMAECEEATSADVSEQLSINREAAQMALLRYHRQGLLSRGGAREKTYRMTVKGEARLRYLVGLAARLRYLTDLADEE